MNSKTFKSDKSNLELGVVRSSEGYLRIWIREPDHKTFGLIDLAPSDAPALDLEILEAAGVEASFDPDATYGTAEQLGHIQDHLHEYVKAKERATAEAKELAELEAEALELMNVRLDAAGNPKHLTKETVDPISLEAWIAVARPAAWQTKR